MYDEILVLVIIIRRFISEVCQNGGQAFIFLSTLFMLMYEKETNCLPISTAFIAKDGDRSNNLMIYMLLIGLYTQVYMALFFFIDNWRHKKASLKGLLSNLHRAIYFNSAAS